MRLIRPVIFCLLILAALQVYAAFELLTWSVPLFADPPMLGNGAARAAGRLREIAEQDPESFRHIQNIDRTFLWFSDRHGEGVLLALVAGAAFAFSAVVNAIFAALLSLKSQVPTGTGT